MMFVLQLISGNTFVISDEQRIKITGYIENGTPKAFNIGDNTIILHQIAGISTKESYIRQMDEKFSRSGRSICPKCFRAVLYSEMCSCKSDPKNFPPLLETARKENPQLAKLLDAVAQQKSLSSPV